MLADAGGRAALAGKVRGLGRLGGSSKPVITASNVSSVPQADGESLFGDGKVSNFVLGSDQIDNDSGQRFTALGLQATFEEDPSQIFFTFNHVGTVQSSSSESLDARNTATINGYAGGLVEPLLPGNMFGQPDNIRIRSNDPDNLDITTDADTNRFNATFKLRDASARNYTLLFGTSTGETGRSAFIDNSRVGAIESALSSAANGSLVATETMPLVSEVLVPEDDFLPVGTSFCECEFVKWGYWAADLDYGSAHVDADRRDRIHLATWVAGNLPKLAEIPSSGIATYRGHVNGSVFNNGDIYQAAGSFANVWNFATKTGAFTVTNFDGANYVGTASAANRRDFTGVFTGANRTGQLSGSFFKGGGDPAAEQGGQFILSEDSGTVYRVGGTFAASK